MKKKIREISSIDLIEIPMLHFAVGIPIYILRNKCNLSQSAIGDIVKETLYNHVLMERIMAVGRCIAVINNTYEGEFLKMATVGDCIITDPSLIFTQPHSIHSQI